MKAKSHAILDEGGMQVEEATVYLNNLLTRHQKKSNKIVQEPCVLACAAVGLAQTEPDSTQSLSLIHI